MSRRRSRGEDEPVLFDLPLDVTADVADDARAAAPEPGDAEPAPPAEESAPEAFDEPAPEGEAFTAEDAPGTAPERDAPAADRTPEGAPAGPETATLSARFLGGLADLTLHLALGVALLFGSRWLGADTGLADWPALVPFLLVFSFLYTVLTLAFWSQTPGMAWAGLVTRAAGDQSLTFGQTARRWAGGLLTVLLLGLPALLAAGGRRSLADRLSDSDTRPAGP